MLNAESIPGVGSTSRTSWDSTPSHNRLTMHLAQIVENYAESSLPRPLRRIPAYQPIHTIGQEPVRTLFHRRVDGKPQFLRSAKPPILMTEPLPVNVAPPQPTYLAEAEDTFEDTLGHIPHVQLGTIIPTHPELIISHGKVMQQQSSPRLADRFAYVKRKLKEGRFSQLSFPERVQLMKSALFTTIEQQGAFYLTDIDPVSELPVHIGMVSHEKILDEGERLSIQLAQPDNTWLTLHLYPNGAARTFMYSPHPRAHQPQEKVIPIPTDILLKRVAQPLQQLLGTSTEEIHQEAYAILRDFEEHAVENKQQALQTPTDTVLPQWRQLWHMLQQHVRTITTQFNPPPPYLSLIPDILIEDLKQQELLRQKMIIQESWDTEEELFQQQQEAQQEDLRSGKEIVISLPFATIYLQCMSSSVVSMQKRSTETSSGRERIIEVPVVQSFPGLRIIRHDHDERLVTVMQGEPISSNGTGEPRIKFRMWNLAHGMYEHPLTELTDLRTGKIEPFGSMESATPYETELTQVTLQQLQGTPEAQHLMGIVYAFFPTLPFTTL